SSPALSVRCTIASTFGPPAFSTQNATLTVTGGAPNSPQTASLAGTGASSTGGVVYLVTKAYGAYQNSSVAASTITSGAFAVPSGARIVAYSGITTSTTITPAISDTPSTVSHQLGATANGSAPEWLALYCAATSTGS